MTRNRFEIFLKTFYYLNNAECRKSDRLQKIYGLTDLLVEKFKFWNKLREKLCIDESNSFCRTTVISSTY